MVSFLLIYVFFSSCTRSILNYEMLICLLFKEIQLLMGEQTIIVVPMTSVLKQTKKGLFSASLQHLADTFTSEMQWVSAVELL